MRVDYLQIRLQIMSGRNPIMLCVVYYVYWHRSVHDCFCVLKVSSLSQNIILVHHLKNCLACEVISYAAEQNMLVKRFQNHLWIYGFIILGARGVFPALKNMAATGTTSMYISCHPGSINRVIRVLEEEHTQRRN